MTADETKAQDDKVRAGGAILTAEDRQRWIRGLKRGAASREHIERLKLIYAPFPDVRRLGTGSAMPWAGTVVADTFFGGVERPHGMHGSGSALARNSVDDDTVYGALYRDALRAYEEAS